MKKIFQPVLAAGLVIAAASVPMLPTAVAAQEARSVGVVSLPAVIGNSNAYKTSEQQIPTTYKAQIDQAEARRAQLAAQLKPMVDKFNADRQAASPNQQALQQQAAQIQQIEQSGQRELQQILAPVSLSRAYVQEQIEDKLSDAVQAAAKKKNVTLVLDASSGQVIYADASHNITQAVLDEVNRLVPSVQITPPAGWLPREMREQQAAAQAAAQGAPAAQQQQPSGR